jgi:CheY-like chemotaxis protein
VHAPYASFAFKVSKLDVVLLDHRLGGGMTGVECLRALRRQCHTRQPGVALMTADWEVQDGDARELGAILVHKACDFDQIHDTVVYLSGV